MPDAIDEVFQDVANAIRSRTGETAAMAPSEFAGKIAAISTLPNVSPADEGKVLQVVDGTWAAAEDTPAAVPTFDLAALGLQTLTVGTQKNVSTDTTAIRAALDRGPVRFIVPVNLGLTLNTGIVVNNVSSGGDYICSHFMNPYVFELTVTTSGVQVSLASLEDVFPPGVTEDDDGKILQVVDGVWSAVTVANSSIGKYIDDYISEALGGDY